MARGQDLFGDYLRFLCRVIGDENHFPTNKNLVWGAYIDQLFMPDNFAFMGQKIFINEKEPKTDMGSSSWLQNMQNRTSHTIYFTRIFFQQKFQKVSKKARFGPFFTNKIFRPINAKLLGMKIWSI